MNMYKLIQYSQQLKYRNTILGLSCMDYHNKLTMDVDLKCIIGYNKLELVMNNKFINILLIA